MIERFQEAKRMAAGRGSDLEAKSISVLGGREVGSYVGVGAEPRVPRRARNRHQCLWGGFEGVECAGQSPAGDPGSGIPGAAQSIRRLGEWCEGWCLPCQGTAATQAGRAPWPQKCLLHPLHPQSFPPLFECSHKCRQTRRRTKTLGKKTKKRERATVRTCLLNLRDMRSD